MNYDNLLYDIENEVLTITINRPDKMNALNTATMREIEAAFSEAFADNSIKVIILTGSGTKSFVAGADISEFVGKDSAGGAEMSQYGQSVFAKIERGSKPVIAAVNGFALGGGCELAMACHIRVASENARFGQPEVNLGLIPGYGGTQRLAQSIGKSKAFELLMTGDMIGSEESRALGLVNAVCDVEHLLEQCHKLADKIKSKSPMAIAKVIEAMNASYETGVDGYQKEVTLFGSCFETNDFVEGVSAFVEKRKPGFTGN